MALCEGLGKVANFCPDSAIRGVHNHRFIDSGSLAQVFGPGIHAGVVMLLIIGDIRLQLNRPSGRLNWIKWHLFRILLAAAFAIRAVIWN